MLIAYNFIIALH